MGFYLLFILEAGGWGAEKTATATSEGLGGRKTGRSRTRGGWGFLCERHKELVNTIVGTVEGTPSNQPGFIVRG